MSTPSKAIVVFNWSKHSDAGPQWEHFKMIRSNKQSRGDGKVSMSYLDVPEQLAAAKKVVPAAYQELEDEEVFQLSVSEMRKYEFCVKRSNDAIKKATDANLVIENHFSICIADIEDMFKIDCNARQYIKQARIVTESKELQYIAVLARLADEFEPSTSLDASKTRRIFEALTDVGRSFTDYYAEHTRLMDVLVNLDARPTDDSIETALIEHFHNEEFAEGIKSLIKDRATTGGVRTHTWKSFLDDCANICAAKSDCDNWGLNKEEKAPDVVGHSARWVQVSKSKSEGRSKSSGGDTEKSSSKSSGGASGYPCWRCGVPGHRYYSCPSIKCHKCSKTIGTVPKVISADSLDHDSRSCATPRVPLPAKARALRALMGKVQDKLDVLSGDKPSKKHQRSEKAKSSKSKAKAKKARKVEKVEEDESDAGTEDTRSTK
jgi:hypothetical protein